MSSNPNNIINLANYEEFFILYMDGELSADEMKAVDAFLLDHPELKTELDLLLSTKLPLENMSLDKSTLMSDAMKMEAVDENLLLYIDDELEGEAKLQVESKLATDFRLPYEQLLRTKLDPNEVISHPNRKELYRHEEKLVFFKPWMRVAVAVLVLAIAGWMVFNSGKTIQGKGDDESSVATVNEKKNAPEDQDLQDKKDQDLQDKKDQDLQDGKDGNLQDKKNRHLRDRKDQRYDDRYKTDNIAVNDPEPVRNGMRTNTVSVDMTRSKDVVVLSPSEILNRKPVTNTPERRNTNITTASQQNAVAKGSVKGFLRRATKLIEKRTGIDPTNDGELLIGALALKLK